MNLRPQTPRPKPAAHIDLGGRRITFRLVSSERARKIRVRIGIDGMDVIHPVGRDDDEVFAFLEANQTWIIAQVDRVDRMRVVRRPLRQDGASIFYRGERTPVLVEAKPRHRTSNRVLYEDGRLIVERGARSSTTPARTLENWLRKQARAEIERHLAFVVPILGADAGRNYVMSQRTKWGNCSALRNLSFNWRLIMAPEFVLHYLVIHEAVHLTVPRSLKAFLADRPEPVPKNGAGEAMARCERR